MSGWCPVRDRAQRRDRARQHFIVGIHEPDVTAGGRLEQGVAGGAQPTIALMQQQADSRCVLCADLLAQLP